MDEADHTKEHSPLLGRSADGVEEIGLAGQGEGLFTKNLVNSPVSTVFLILNIMIGSGFLLQASVFLEAGIILAIFFYLFVGTICYQACILMLAVCRKLHTYDVSDASYACLGVYGAVAWDLSIVLTLGGSLLSYLLLLGSLSNTILTDNLSVSSNAWYVNESFITTLWFIFIIVPLSMVRQLGNLAIIAYYSITVVFATILMVVTLGPISYASKHSSDSLRWWKTQGFSNSLSALSLVLFAMAYLPAVMPAYQTAHPSTQKHFSLYLLFCSVLGISVYFILGLVGYVTFREDTKVDILENFSGGVSVLFQCFICFHLAFIIPGYLVIIRQALAKLVFYRERSKDTIESSESLFYAVTMILLSILYIATIALQLTIGGDSSTISLVTSITGGITGSIEIFAIPGLCGLVVFSPQFRQWTGMSFPVAPNKPPQGNDSYGTVVADPVDGKVLIWSHEEYYTVWSYILVVVGCVVAILVTIGTCASS